MLNTGQAPPMPMLMPSLAWYDVTKIYFGAGEGGRDVTDWVI